MSFAAPARRVRAQDEPAKDEAEKPAPKPSKKKAAAKKKGYDYERSKYKSRELSQTINYKFNEKGDPVVPGAKKKSSAKKKKRSEPPEADLKEGPEACGAEGSCVEKKTEADAL